MLSASNLPYSFKLKAVIQMSLTKVMELSELDKLKSEKMATAKACLSCNNIPNWDKTSQSFKRKKGFCTKCYERFKRHGDPKKVLVQRGVEKPKHIKINCDNDGRTSHYLYGTYNLMRQRCYNVKNNRYYCYGLLGIKVCEEWLDRNNGFWQFVSDMGERPNGTTLDRKDRKGNYCKHNCRWATNYEQMANMSTNNKNIGVHFDKSRCKWVASIKIKDKQLHKRFHTQIEAIQCRKEWEIKYEIIYQ